MTPEEIERVVQMARRGMSIRGIAKALGRNVKTIRKLLRSRPAPPPPKKLETFEPIVRELAEKQLAAPRILREIQQRGYTGSLTVLKDLLRSLRGPQQVPRKVFRRFETGPGEEAQVDWSLYRIPIAGVPTPVNCFSLVLAYSRKLFVAFYRNQRLPTLLHAHAAAFQDFSGTPRTVVYDNQTTVTLGRVGGKPLWNPAFLEFARHYGFTPRVCRPRDPDRKGKVERPFGYIETDFLRASEFASWEDLNRRVREWLDTVANRRVHGTTRQIPDERFLQEKDLLIRLPQIPYATARHEVRKVQLDGYLSVDGSFYPVPAALVGQYVSVRIFPERVEVLDARGKVVVTHRVPDRPCRLPSDGAPPGRAQGSVSRPVLEAGFLARFPDATAFLDGLKRRMKTLTHIHLRQIERLVDLYSQAEVRKAIQRASEYRNFNAGVLERILQDWHPNVVPEPPVTPVNGLPASFAALDEVESGSPEEYTLDTDDATEENHDAQE